MRFTSPSRRALGLLAASTIGMSTAVLGVAGVASAAPTPSLVIDSSSSTAVVVPAGICAVDWTLTGARGGSSSTPLPGGSGGRLVIRTEVYPGDEFELAVGNPGGSATGTAAGAGGVNTHHTYDGQAGETYYDTDEVTPIGGSGGGGAATAVLEDGSPYLVAFGGVGGGPSGGYGSYGTENFKGYGNPAPSTDGQAPLNATPGITGTGVACVADAPYLNFVNPGDGSATLFFAAPQSDNGIPVTGYEVSVNGVWGPLTTTAEDNGFSGTVTGLTNETPYTLAVRAVGGTNNSLKGEASQPQTVTPYVPLAAPTNVRVTTTTSRVTVSWTAVPGQVKGYDVGISYGQSGGQGCAVTDPSVTTCTFFTQAGSGIEVGVRAIDMQDRPGTYASQTGLTVPGPATPSSVPTKDDGDITGPAGAISKLSAGQKVTLQGSGYAPNSTVQLLVYSSPVSLGTVVTDSTGSFSVEVTVPANLANGTHHLVATGVDAQGNARNLVIAVTVSGGVATLATTGFDTVPVAVGGALVLLVGGGLLVGARRRSTNA